MKAPLRTGWTAVGFVLTLGFANLVGGAQEIDQKAACLPCHKEMAKELEATVTHEPAAKGQCTACHSPHVSRFSGLLRERPGPLCIQCHEPVAEELALDVVHQPVEEGRCVDCHAPHGGPHDKLLTAPGTELCSTCHMEIADWQSRPNLHSPFRLNECSTCHQPHASSFANLSKSPGSGTCMSASCHPNNAAFQTAHRGYPVVEADCSRCHDPHASMQAGFFRGLLHKPFAEGDCSDCHASAASANPFQVKETQDRLCGGNCHMEQVLLSRDAPFSHVSAGGVGCTACHNPHAGDETGLLNERPQELCLSCHDPGGASSGQAGRFTSHGENLICSSCHAPHGAEQPLLLITDPVSLCTKCHTHRHGSSHPMGVGARDPRNGQLMDCLSCHAMHDAPYDKYMHFGGERELCISCHTLLEGEWQ